MFITEQVWKFLELSVSQSANTCLADTLHLLTF